VQEGSSGHRMHLIETITISNLTQFEIKEHTIELKNKELKDKCISNLAVSKSGTVIIYTLTDFQNKEQ
jgi:hypothetical protein